MRAAVLAILLLAAAPGWAQDEEERFPGYAPKTAADTALDYRPELADEIAALPPASLEALGELGVQWAEFEFRAGQDPGEWVVGNVALGAEPREYVPSDPELIAAELGARVEAVLAALPPERRLVEARNVWLRYPFTYRAFGFRHVDVMGSGRFFYASPPEERTAGGGE